MGQDAGQQWIVRLVCCGCDDGEYRATTWQEADDFRESYMNAGGHVRSGIIARDPEPK